MRSVLFGLAGLVLGVLGALDYSHYFGEGRKLIEVQAQLSQSASTLAKAVDDSKQTKKEADAMSAQIQQLVASNDDLKKQVAAQTPATPPAAPAIPFGNMGGMVKDVMAHQAEERLILLKSRLHLTVEQEAALKATMDDESKRTEAMANKMLVGGKIDMQAAAADYKNFKTVDQTLNEILNPEQKTQYQQMKTDEKNSAAEMSASVQLNQMAPLLQLTDAQKDQVYNALAQVQLNNTEPNWIKSNVKPGIPTSILDAQAKAKEDALAKILTPEQLATYHQQTQSQLAMQKAMMQKFMPAGSAGAGTSPAAASSQATPAGP